MALFVTNLTGSPVTLAASNTSVIVPANQTYNVTSEIQGLSGGQYTSLDAQRISGTLSFFWIGIPLYATPGLTVTGASSATPANVAGLAAIANPGGPTWAQVQSTLALYLFDPYSTATADAINIIAPPTGAGRWVRQRTGHDQWRQQSDWYVDSVSGNDQNSGADSVNPIKTIKELSYRLGGVTIRPLTVNLLANLPSTDPLSQLTLIAEWDTSLSPSNAPFLAIIGTQTIVRTSTFTSTGTVPVPASNLASSATDTTVADWTSDVGSLLVVTSGVAAGSYAWPVKDLTSGVVRLSRWQTSTHSNASTMPAPGDSYKIVSLTTIPADVPSLVSPSQLLSPNISLTNINLNGALIVEQPTGRLLQLVTSKISGIINPKVGMRVLLTSCYSTGTVFVVEQAYLLTTGSVSVTTQAHNIQLGATVDLRDHIFQGGTLNCLSNSATVLTNVGIFDVTGTGLSVQTGAFVDIQAGSLFGSGNTTGCVVLRGGRMRIATGLTPTLTGTTEFQFDILASVIPPLTAGASVPATSALATWANWNAAPFSRNVVSYKSGSWVTS